MAILAGAIFGFMLIGPASATPMEAFNELDEAMRTASEEYGDALEEAELARSATHPLPVKAEPIDGRIAVLEKLDALTKASVHSADGAYIAVESFLWAVSIDAKDGLKRFKWLAEQFPDDAHLDDALAAVEEIRSDSGNPEDWLSTLEALRRATKRAEAGRAALMEIGRISMDLQKLIKAKSVFETLVKDAADSEVTETAKGFLYEIDHLQIGMVAPNFTTQRLDGREITLNSLRGKTVLLNFWASW